MQLNMFKDINIIAWFTKWMHQCDKKKIELKYFALQYTFMYYGVVVWGLKPLGFQFYFHFVRNMLSWICLLIHTLR